VTAEPPFVHFVISDSAIGESMVIALTNRERLTNHESQNLKCPRAVAALRASASLAVALRRLGGFEVAARRRASVVA
jgi:hypothetical protein